jgi:hypothetical protein
VTNVKNSYPLHPFSPPTHPHHSPGLNCKRKKFYLPCPLPPARHCCTRATSELLAAVPHRPTTGPIEPPVVEPSTARRVDFSPPPVASAPPRWQLHDAWAEGASTPTPAQVCHRQESGHRPQTPAPHPPPLATSHRRPFFSSFLWIYFECDEIWDSIWVKLTRFDYVRIKMTTFE